MAKGKWIECRGTICEALHEAADELGLLKDEMVEWRDNLDSNNMNHLPKYDEVSECADLLESSGAEEKLVALIDELETAAEGHVGEPACEPHQLGKSCPRCLWQGRLSAAEPLPELRIIDEPVFAVECGDRIRLSSYTATCAEVIRTPALIDVYRIYSDELRPLRPSEVSQKHEQARRDWWRWAERITERNESRLRLPPEQPAVAEVPASEPLAALLAKELTWRAWRNYRKGLSRAHRFSNAIAAADAALSAIETPFPEEVGEAFDDVRDALDELEGIDFPGMF